MWGDDHGVPSPLVGGGEMGQCVRDTDWSATPLGDFALWPQSLRSTLSLVLNSKGIAALYWGPEQWLLYNDAYGAALGERHPWAFGRSMPEVLPDIAPVLGPQVAEVLETGQGFAIENLPLVMCRNGRDEETVWTYSFSAVQGEGQGFAGVLLLATEMTRQKLAERSGDKVRTRLAAALRVARLGTYEWHVSTGLVELDARSRELFGLPPRGEIRAETVFGRMAPEDMERVQNEAMVAVGLDIPFDPGNLARIIDINYDIVLPDGLRRSIESSGTVFENPDGTRRMVGSFNDVSALKRAEAELQQQNASLEQRVEERTRERDRMWKNSLDLMVVLSPDGTYQRTNPAWAEVLGYAVDELVGLHATVLIHPDDVAATLWALQHAQGERLANFENRFRHKDGSYRWLQWSAAPDTGEVFAVGRDVTAAKEAEALLRQTEDALRQSQKMEAVGQLTGGLAHDFNNLLTGVTGSLELLQTRMAQGRIKDVDRYVVAAQGAAKRAAALTHRLLAFSRRQTLDPKPTDVNRLVAGMEDLIRRTIGPAITLEPVVGAGGLWRILVDAGQLENALLNLCINARDAMPDGGKITVETGNCWLDERMAQERDLPPGQYLSLCVSDTGTGMTPDVIAKAFDPFFTTKPIGMGTGLGLSMIYGFAKQSGGQVRIYSEVGQGTNVCLYLPRHLGEAEVAELAPELANAPRAEQGQTVLVVDDEPTVRMLVAEVLEDLGYLAVEAADGAAGLRVLQSDARIDLLVTDVGLPGGMNGRQVADAARVARPDLKVLFITGYAENAVLSHGHLDSGMHVLTKPFAMEVLARRIKDLISD